MMNASDIYPRILTEEEVLILAGVSEMEALESGHHKPIDDFH